MLRWNPIRCAPTAALLATLTLLSGCRTIHEVKIDAINDPARPMGASYRLDLRDPSGSVDKDLGAQAARDIRDALAARGLYEAPPGASPDMVIDAEFGIGPGQMKIIYRSRDALGGGLMSPRTGGSEAKPILVFEKYIKLSARQATPEDLQPGPGNRRNRGEEIWSLTVSIEDATKDLGPYLDILASSSIGYIGTNTGAEKTIEVDDGIARATLRRQN